ncbi:hydroxypyruvate isomerase family protein [Granulosicoccus antarcticus]|uniref:Hydroxypyruvate isomerase YgbM n=1 Tax=Granulosicoccus antarcticus IMCC3135 TaxID=1192854 RepID=A0A2Z2NMJ2_9GAMM|nr:TIM barrel protein [Granulosicoccus antarcticus]ASJ72682.1 Putative hydroxypyruvate isomerase YgbM [Granulosicoccus antarcticus IMCC3135]
MTKFSANLGFLWTELSLPDAIRAARSAGFDAVECHWPYDTPTDDINAALAETGLSMLGLNARRGDTSAGENGLSALPDRITQARSFIDEAIQYASLTNTACVHVMAGFVSGSQAHKTFIENLQYACDQAASHNITILIEPLNSYDAPGYFLSTSEQAESIITEVDRTNIKLMFDCYHIQLMEGDLSNRLTRLLPIIGHIQFASVPDRGSPEHGEVCYRHIFDVLSKLGYKSALGAEYKPAGKTDQTLGWMSTLK